MVEAEEDRAGERRRCSPLMAATHSLTPASTPPRLASRQDKRKNCTTRHQAPTSEQRRTPQGSGGQNDTDKQQRGRSALSQRDLLHTLHPAARHWCSTGAAPVLPTDSPTNSVQRLRHTVRRTSEGRWVGEQNSRVANQKDRGGGGTEGTETGTGDTEADTDTTEGRRAETERSGGRRRRRSTTEEVNRLTSERAEARRSTRPACMATSAALWVASVSLHVHE